MRNIVLPAIQTLVLLSFLLISRSGNAQELNRAVSPADIQFDPGRSAARIPFELVGNFVFLHVGVNGSDPLWFLLDTGASASYLDVQRAKALEVGDGSSIKDTTLRFPGLKLMKQRFVLQPLTFGIYSGHPIDGMLGYDFISRFVVEIDYVSKIVRLSAPQSYHYSGSGQILPLSLLEDDSGGKVPLVRLRVIQQGRSPIEGKFIADTAVRNALSFNTPFVEKHTLLRFAHKTIQAPLGGGAMVRESKQSVGRVPRVQLGKFTFRNPAAVFFQVRQGVIASPEFDGVLGAELLRRFNVVYDYTRLRLILEPNRQFAEPAEYDSSGTLLIAEGADFKTFKVKQVIENSPATAAGIRAGDVISAVDGKPATSLTLEHLRRIFRQPGRQVQLIIERGGQKVRTILKLKRLI